MSTSNDEIPPIPSEEFVAVDVIVTPGHNEQDVRRTSKRFSASDADISLQSSDGIVFEVHRKNLELHSEGFASANAISLGADSDKEVVPLSETSEVLELLLQYMYRQRQPDLEVVPFTVLSSLAEAAEKYEVFSAITICNVYMRRTSKQHPHECILYAYRHNYIDILDEAAPLTIKDASAFCLFVSLTTPNILIPWVRYHQLWINALDDIHKDHKSSYIHRSQSGNVCSWPELWLRVCDAIATDLGGNPRSLTSLDFVFARGTALASQKCSICEAAADDWRVRAQERVDEIPKFSTLI